MPIDEIEQAIGRCRCHVQPVLWQDYRRLTRRLEQGKPVDRLQLRLQQALATEQETIQQRRSRLPMLRYDDSLPVNQRRDDIHRLIDDNQVVIVCGETGSGKTTQIPKICLEAGLGLRGQIGHTQPRRLAARSVAARLAQELGCQVGEHVGFKIRFHDRVSDDSYIKLMTDGILLAEIQSDRMLRNYDTLIIDEAHERSLNIDFLLGYLKTLLPKRPDLKLIITSATIDPQGFSGFFNDAPVIEVSGRSYPVETRYRPLVSDEPDQRDRDMISGILHAVDELAAGPDRGDILIFVSGEREIRETAEALRKHHPPQVEILPLYSRLSASEQDRIFKPHGRQRLIIATNVAETSLTVPGIRHVVDTGLARISRYSHRSKIQRLPIEPVSQASANQRQGRCGRTAPGICIRLYSEQDFMQRPEFTDPEIRRTNLASVILSMSHLRLGRIEDFPFINPPDTRVVRDGYRLLTELGALDKSEQLTPLGHQLARLPVDPRLGRMLLAADEHHALAEILIIVSALTVQDPRERPHDKREQAAQKHRLFQHEKSDFLTLLKLWHAFGEQGAHLSQNKLRRWCRDHFLSWMRMREWREIHKQLRGQLKQMGFHPNETPATYDQVHRALLTGLLSHIGQRDENLDYRGPRQRVFRLAPDSVLTKKPPRWLISATLVETQRIYARTNAAVEPEWIEQAAGPLCRKQYIEPHWEQRTGRVMAWEQVNVLGLVVIPRRKIHYGPIDPVLARELFIRGALVEGRYHSKARFLNHNRALIAELEDMEHKRRRRDVVDDEVIFRFYDQRIPAYIHQARSFERWLKKMGTDGSHLLDMNRDDLLAQTPALAQDQFPDHVEVGGLELKLHYRFDPGHPLDGVTVDIPLHHLNAVSEHDFDWLVPGLIRDKINHLFKALPKQLRRRLVPLPETVTLCLQHAPHDGRPLVQSLSHCLSEQSGVDIPLDAWRTDDLPPHLRMNYRIIDLDGNELASGRNLPRLKHEFAERAGQAFSSVPEWPVQRTGITEWDFGDLPERLSQMHHGTEIVGYPALIVDEQDTLSIEVLDNPEHARHMHHAGIHALLLKYLPQQSRYLKRQLPDIKRQCLLYATVGDCQTLTEDLIALILDESFLSQVALPYRQQDFKVILDAGRGRLIETAERISRLNLEILGFFHTISSSLDSGSYPKESVEDIEQQLTMLIYPGYLQQAGIQHLRHYPRYLKAVQARLNKLSDKPMRESHLRTHVTPYMQRYIDLAVNWDTLVDEQKTLLEDYHWLLEEFRVSLFAQELGTAQPVSAKRLERLWQEVMQMV